MDHDILWCLGYALVTLVIWSYGFFTDDKNVRDYGVKAFNLGLFWLPVLAYLVVFGGFVCVVLGISRLREVTLAKIAHHRALRLDRANRRQADRILSAHLGGLASEHPWLPLHEPLKLDIPKIKKDLGYRDAHCKECGQALVRKSA